MTRIIKEYAVRRNEILDAAQQLVFSKGFEQMTIQDLLDTLKISKGAFYHYFDSKQALLEVMVERIQQDAEKIYLPIAHDPNLKGLEKLEQIFGTVARWKTTQIDFLFSLLKTWYADENVVFRQKVTTRGVENLIPILKIIIQESIEQGVMDASFAGQTAEVVAAMMTDMGDKVARLLLATNLEDVNECREKYREMEQIVAVYTRSIERVLGVSSGSLVFFEIETLKEWVIPVNRKNRENIG